MSDATPAVPGPVEIPYRQLSADALQGLIESFVLREGTEYGAQDVPLEVKRAQVMRQLEKGEARICFDPESETVDIELVRRSRVASRRIL